MATLALAAAGAAVGSALLPAGITILGATLTGAAIGAQVGAFAGSLVDRALFGASGMGRAVSGPRLTELHITGSVEVSDAGSTSTQIQAQCVASIFSVASQTESVHGAPVAVKADEADYVSATIQSGTSIGVGAYSVHLNCWDTATTAASVNRAALSVIATAS